MSQDGFATIETIPLIFLFIIMSCYAMGFFGVVHTGILNSISARAYAFETFRNRSNLTYFRDTVFNGGSPSQLLSYSKVGNRTHGITREFRSSDEFIVTERPIRVGYPIAPDERRGDLELHNQTIHSQVQFGKRNTDLASSPVWIKVQYGMCLNVSCGGDD